MSLAAVSAVLATGYITAAPDDQMDNPSVVHLVPLWWQFHVLTVSVPYPQEAAADCVRVFTHLQAMPWQNIRLGSRGRLKSESVEILNF